MNTETRAALEVLGQELETDVRAARTRDESMRLTRRVLRLKAILAAEVNAETYLSAALPGSRDTFTP